MLIFESDYAYQLVGCIINLISPHWYTNKLLVPQFLSQTLRCIKLKHGNNGLEQYLS
jgi:hypothetical protein